MDEYTKEVPAWRFGVSMISFTLILVAVLVALVFQESSMAKYASRGMGLTGVGLIAYLVGKPL